MATAETTPIHHRRKTLPASLAIATLAALLILPGLFLLAAGLWLIALGGSWYYAPTGLAMVVSSILVMRGSRLGVWLYLLIFAVTVAWALWEVGLQGWPLVPRVAAPAVLAVFAIAVLPLLDKDQG